MNDIFTNPLPGVPIVESPFFEAILKTQRLPVAWQRIATDLHRDGFAVFDFPDPDFGYRSEEIRNALGPRYNWQHWRENGYAIGAGLRIQDAWQFDQNVKALAVNEEVLRLLSALYGRKAWPFQTLNFPVGTQQHYHSDSAHFSAVPERFMCGVWVALEDIEADSGPLFYYPGSHKWPIYTNEHIGLSGRTNQESYEPLWRRLVEHHGVKPAYFTPKKGQALIWAANLLHGGSRQTNPNRTRWSQVTHYYFADCVYYTPMYSNPFAGQILYREMMDIATGLPMPNMYGGQAVSRDVISFNDRPDPRLPASFDPLAYLKVNPDVAAAGVNPAAHYLEFGEREGRPLR